MTRYDEIGAGYALGRRTDPRWLAPVLDALGSAATVLDVGSGTGSYEPPQRQVVAVEPSAEMIRQRRPEAAPVVRAVAEALPFASGTFDAALAVLTLHHWSDWRAGLREMQRTAARLVVFAFDPTTVARRFWLTAVYFPEIAELDRGRCPSVAEIAAELGPCRVETVAIPHDCADGFLAAYWRRPEAYLDPAVRAGMSGFARLDREVMASGVARLAADLQSGAWEHRFGRLRSLDALDAGYRLVVTS